MTPRNRQHRQLSSSVAVVALESVRIRINVPSFVAVETHLFADQLPTALVYLRIPQSLLNNGSTCHSTTLQIFVPIRAIIYGHSCCSWNISVASVRKRSVPTDDRHLTKFSANLWIEGCRVVSAADAPRSLISVSLFLEYFFEIT
jgi:hypothetical protein